MTFKDFLITHKNHGGSQKALSIEMGISESAMSRIISKKQKIGLKMLYRLLAAGNGNLSMEELMKEFRPDLYHKIIREGKL